MGRDFGFMPGMSCPLYYSSILPPMANVTDRYELLAAIKRAEKNEEVFFRKEIADEEARRRRATKLKPNETVILHAEAYPRDGEAIRRRRFLSHEFCSCDDDFDTFAPRAVARWTRTLQPGMYDIRARVRIMRTDIPCGDLCPVREYVDCTPNFRVLDPNDPNPLNFPILQPR